MVDELIKADPKKIIYASNFNEMQKGFIQLLQNHTHAPGERVPANVTIETESGKTQVTREIPFSAVSLPYMVDIVLVAKNLLPDSWKQKDAGNPTTFWVPIPYPNPLQTEKVAVVGCAFPMNFEATSADFSYGFTVTSSNPNSKTIDLQIKCDKLKNVTVQQLLLIVKTMRI